MPQYDEYLPTPSMQGATGIKLRNISQAANQVAYDGFGEAFTESLMEDSFPATFAKWYYTPDEDDPNFSVTPEFFAQEAPDLAHRYEDLKNARSLPEFTYRADRVRREELHKQKLGGTDYGWGAAIAAGIIDPVFLAASVATWGAGSIPALTGQGARLGGLALGAGRLAMIGGRPSRLAGLARGGVLTGTAEGTVLGVQTQLSDTFGLSDAVYGTLMSAGLGAGIGGAFPSTTVTSSWMKAADELIAQETLHPTAQALRLTARGEAVLPATRLPPAPTLSELSNEMRRLDTLLEETEDFLTRSGVDLEADDLTDDAIDALGWFRDDADMPSNVSETGDFIQVSRDELKALHTRRQAIKEARETLGDRIALASNDPAARAQIDVAREPRRTDSSEWLPGQREIDTIVVRETEIPDELLNSNVADPKAYGSFGELDSTKVHEGAELPAAGPNNDSFVGRLYNQWENFAPFRWARHRVQTGLNSRNERIRAITSISEEDGLLRTKYPLQVAAKRQADQALTVLAQNLHTVRRRVHAHLKREGQLTRFRGVGWRAKLDRQIADYVTTGQLPKNDAVLAGMVEEAGKHVQTHYKVLRDYAVKMGKLPDDVPSDPRYLNRMANKDVVTRIVNMRGANRPYDREWLEDFMAESLIKGSAEKGLDLTKRQAKVMASRWIRNNTTDKSGRGSARHKGDESWEADQQEMRELLRSEGVSEDAIDEFIELVAPKHGTDFTHAHRRMLFDESHVGLDRNGDEFTFRDLLSNDIDSLAELYTRRLTGSVEWNQLAKILNRMTPDDDTLKHAEIDGEIVTEAQMLKWMENGGELTRREVEYITSAYRSYHQLPTDATFMGVSFKDTGHPIAKFMRGMSWLMHVRVMNKVGLSTLPEVFGAVGTHGLHMLYHMADFKGLSRPLAAGGKRAGALAAACEAISGGIGADLLRRLHLHRLDADSDFKGSGLESVGFKKWFSRGRAFIMDVTHRNPAGMGPIDTYTRNAAMSAAVSDFLWGIHKVGSRKGLEGFERNAFNAAQRRLADLGLDEEWQKRIWTAMQRPGAVQNVKGVHSIYNHVDFDAWADPEAVEMFGMALYRHVNRVVQRPDFGTVAPWMDSPIGRVVAQFRSFMMVANTKQLGYNISKLDSKGFNTVMMSLFGGTLTYYTMIQAATIGMSAEKRQEYIRKYLHTGSWDDFSNYKWEDILWNGVGRSGFATTLIPAYVTAENILGIPDEERLFGPQSRNTGLGVGLFDGIPTVDYINDMLNAGSGLMDVAFNRDQFSQEDAQAIYRLLPLQNLLGVQNIFNRLTQELGLPSHR